MTATTASIVMLWLSVGALGLLTLALARQIGILHERVAPVGALMMQRSIAVGEAAPRLDVQSLNGTTIAIGAPAARSMLLFFLSPTCPVCKKLLPILGSMAADESDTLDIVLAGDGSEVDYRRVVDGAGVAELPLALSEQLGIRFRIGKLPYAVLIGTDGRIAAQGLVNSREQIESLLTARDLGISSLQHFLARQSASTDILAQA
jgi:methylamine dehydrogenase accessory protein MauD